MIDIQQTTLCPFVQDTFTLGSQLVQPATDIGHQICKAGTQLQRVIQHTWFEDGELNVSHNCLDRHMGTERENKAALIWQGDEIDDDKKYTYKELHAEVCKFANVLKDMGVEKGDRVCIYLGMVPELAITMMSCARIGAIHSIVFGGFSADALRDRISALSRGPAPATDRNEESSAHNFGSR